VRLSYRSSVSSLRVMNVGAANESELLACSDNEVDRSGQNGRDDAPTAAISKMGRPA
jgi:hypothetical protein